MKKKEYPIKVVTPIEKIQLSEETLDLKVGKTVSLKAEIIPADATSNRLSWFSSNNAVASVQDGKVKAVGEGECNIYCRGLDCGLVTAICHVTVTK